MWLELLYGEYIEIVERKVVLRVRPLLSLLGCIFGFVGRA